MANNTSKIILGFIALIVGISLIAPIATNTEGVTNTITISNETIDINSDRTIAGACPMGVNGTNAIQITNSPSGWKTLGCPVTSFVLKNQTGVTATVTTDYVFYPANGTLMLKNTSKWGICDVSINDTYASYTYCGDDYVQEAWQRTILDLISGFIALALLTASVAIFYSVGKAS